VADRETLLAVLRGDVLRWPAGDARFESAFLELLSRERLEPLLAHRLHEDPLLGEDWPETVKRTLKNRRRRQAAWELAAAHSIGEIVGDLVEQGIAPILLKGTALAYWRYPCAEARPRGDVDILVRRRDVGRLCEVFERRGYRFSAHGIVGQEFQYRRLHMGQGLEFDVHWRISAGLLLAHTLTYEEMLAESIPIPALGDKAIGLSPRHALLHACLHWARHRAGGDHESILWMYDMHLLARGLTEAALMAFAQLALEKKLGAVCAAALGSTQAQLGTSIHPVFFERLQSAPKPEPSARLLGSGAQRLAVGDVWARRSAAAWKEALLDIFLPPPSYLRRQHGAVPGAWLPRLYVERIAKAVVLSLPGSKVRQ